MAQKFINAGRFELLSDLVAEATTINLAAGGAALPVANVGTGQLGSGGDWFRLVLQDASGLEIVAVRSHAAGSDQMMNVLRGQEGTTARAWMVGTVIANRFTAEDAARASDKAFASLTGLPSKLPGYGVNEVHGPEEVEFFYDSSNRIIEIAASLDNDAKSTLFAYNSNGTVKTITTQYLGLTRTVTFLYDGGRLYRTTAEEVRHE